MDESIKELGLHGKNVVVIGGSRGLGRALVAAAHAEGAQVLAVARQEAELRKVAEELSGVQVLALDATQESAPARVFAALSPDVLLVCAGAVPHMAPLGEQSWEQFSRNWNNRLHLGLRFLALAPGNIMPETDMGKTAASAYAASRGLSVEDFISLQRGGQPLVTPDLVANALIELASDPQKSAGKSFLLSGKGMEIVP